MSSTPSTVSYVVDQLGAGVIAKPMFGEYGIYARGVLVGLICDDRLFLKVTTVGSTLIPDHESASPYPGAKPAIVVAEELWDDRDLMSQLATATAAELALRPQRAKAKPTPKPKAPKARPKPKAKPKPKPKPRKRT